MHKYVKPTDTGVIINFTGNVEKKNIIKMVENCSTGVCDCMNQEIKEKISTMQVDGKDGNVSLTLEGSISQEEITAALNKSMVLNS